MKDQRMSTLPFGLLRLHNNESRNKTVRSFFHVYIFFFLQVEEIFQSEKQCTQTPESLWLAKAPLACNHGSQLSWEIVMYFILIKAHVSVTRHRWYPGPIKSQSSLPILKFEKEAVSRPSTVDADSFLSIPKKEQL